MISYMISHMTLRPGTVVPPAAVIRFFFLPARLWDGYSFYRPAFGTVTVSYTCDLHCGPSQNLKIKTNCKEIKTIPFETLKSHCVQCPGKSCVLAPCCPPFHRIPIAPTNFQAQISDCRISRFRSETTGSHRIRESLRPPGKKLRTSYMMRSFPPSFVVADHI